MELIFLPLMAVMVPAIFYLAYRDAVRRREALARTAAAFGGTLRPDPGPKWMQAFGNAEVELPLEGSMRPATLAHVDEGAGEDKRTYTDFSAPLNGGGAWKLHLRPQSALDALGALFGMQDIRVGSAAFDDAFLVKSNQEIAAMTYLTQPEIQTALLELKAMTGSSSLELEVGDRFRVRKLGALSEEGRLREYLDLAGLLYRRLPNGLAFGLPRRRSA